MSRPVGSQGWKEIREREAETPPQPSDDPFLIFGYVLFWILVFFLMLAIWGGAASFGSIR